MIVVFIAFIIGIVLISLLTMIKKDSEFAPLSINLNRIYCPKCNHKQPLIRKPNGQRQALYGGWTCKKCGTEMNIFGEEIFVKRE